MSEKMETLLMLVCFGCLWILSAATLWHVAAVMAKSLGY